MTEMTQEQIDAHNRTELWKDVINHVQVASEALDQAGSALDDLHEEMPYLVPAIVSIGLLAEAVKAAAGGAA